MRAFSICVCVWVEKTHTRKLLVVKCIFRLYLCASLDEMFAIHRSTLDIKLGDSDARCADFIATFIVAFHFSHTYSASYQGHRSISLNAILHGHKLCTIGNDFMAHP